MQRGTALAIRTVLVAALCASVALQVRILPGAVARVTETFPVVAPLTVPAVAWGIVAIACWQVLAFIGLRIVALARNHTFGPPDYGWLRGIVGCLLAFSALVVLAYISLSVAGYGSPGVTLGLVGMGLIALVGASSLALFLGSRPFHGHYPHTRSAPERGQRKNAPATL